jgi:hypothetical protein
MFGQRRGRQRVVASMMSHGEGLGAFYRPGEGEERPRCEGERWLSVGEFKLTVMARGGIGIKRAALVLGVEGLGNA